MKASKTNHSNAFWFSVIRERSKLTISKLVEASWFSYSNEQACEFCSPQESIWTWSLCPSCSSPNAYGWKLPSWLSDRDPLESPVQVLNSATPNYSKKMHLNNLLLDVRKKNNTMSLKNTQDFVSGNTFDLSNPVRITKNNTNLRRG